MELVLLCMVCWGATIIGYFYISFTSSSSDCTFHIAFIQVHACSIGKVESGAYDFWRCIALENSTFRYCIHIMQGVMYNWGN